MTSDPWPFPGDTALQRARKVASSYRAALHTIDPQRCAELDERAVELGQGWVAPVELPAHLAEYALDAELSAADIEHFWRIPASTIRTWAHRGLIASRPALDGSPRYVVGEVLRRNSRLSGP
ncbi:hypothetical protein GCM10009764_25700 [Nocardia ninae]|uniref:Uncharacterized protein n=1 Tax=Nocardia ninae NBRC 108245 TaxID=1210091 RepID=A0A511MBZ4_9NOCA|nr:hypothetical protein NN4_27010 [Nocardia ninae NBRC 108245]